MAAVTVALAAALIAALTVVAGAVVEEGPAVMAVREAVTSAAVTASAVTVALAAALVAALTVVAVREAVTAAAATAAAATVALGAALIVALTVVAGAVVEEDPAAELSRLTSQRGRDAASLRSTTAKPVMAVREARPSLGPHNQKHC